MALAGQTGRFQFGDDDAPQIHTLSVDRSVLSECEDGEAITSNGSDFSI